MAHDNKIITKSAEETQRCGEKLADSLMQERNNAGRVPSIVCLYGELGSGKTTFAQGFAKGLGIPSRLLSPTFIIVRRYSLIDKNTFFYHIDLYRMKSVSDTDGLGLQEIFSDPHAIILIEWAQRLGALLPKTRTDIHFSVLSDDERRIEVRSENSEDSEDQKI